MTTDVRRIGPRSYAVLAALVILGGVWLRLPALRAGFTVDDFAQLAMMKGIYPVPRAPLQLFTFSDGSARELDALRATGFYPWWTHAGLRISMFRPLASALMWLDLAAFGDNALAYHLHSALWWLGMAAAAALLLRRLLPPWAALLALLLFCADEAHGMLLGWIANRNAIVAGALCLLGLWLQLKRREDGFGAGGALALGCYALALGSSECTVGFLAYAGLYTLLQPSPAARRAREIAPLGLLLVAYLAARAALGSGAHGSGIYIDPLGETWAFARAAWQRAPALAGDLVLGLRANWWTGGFPWTPMLVEHGLVGSDWLLDLRPMRALLQATGWLAIAGYALLAASALRARATTRDLRWLVLGAPLALVPSLSSAPESRLLVPALLGWSAAMALLVRDRLAALRARPGSASARAGLVLAWLFTLYHVAFPAWNSAQEVQVLARLAPGVRASILAPELDPLLRPAQRVLLLSAADPTTTIYIPLLRKLYGRVPARDCQLLDAGFVRLRLLRIAPDTFLLDRLSDAYTAGDAYATAFNREPLRRGQRFVSDGMRVTVERVQDGLPMRARFQLDRTLDGPQVLLLQQTAEGLRRVAFPKVGEALVLPTPVAPFALMPPW